MIINSDEENFNAFALSKKSPKTGRHLKFIFKKYLTKAKNNYIFILVGWTKQSS